VTGNYQQELFNGWVLEIITTAAGTTNSARNEKKTIMVLLQISWLIT